MLDFEVSSSEAVLSLDLSQMEQGVLLHNSQSNPASTIHLALIDSRINNDITLHASTCLVGARADLIIRTYNKLEISTENFVGFNSVKVKHINNRQATEQQVVRSTISEEDITALNTIIPAQNPAGYLKLLQLFARNPNYKIADIQNIEKALHVGGLYTHSLIVLRDAANNHHAILSEDTIEYLTNSLITYSPEQNILELRNTAFLLFSLSLNNQYPKNLEKLAIILDKHEDEQLSLYIVKTLENSSSRKLKQIPEFETLLQDIILNSEKSLEIKEYCNKIIAKLHDQDLIRAISNSQNIESFGNEKDLDILLAEIESLNKDTKIEVLKDKYNQVIKSYNHDSVFSPQGMEIKAWDKINISNWAKIVKKSGKAKEQDFIPEVIAVIKRANIIHCGNDPRIVQVLSLLAFNTSLEHGMLAQISTGEGKSTIIAMLAVIKALQGETVDVVTSSYILAKRDAAEKREFFEMFGLLVDHNCDQQKIQGFKACYGSDIVYGDISNFQYDLLRHAYSQLGTRGNREFGVVIVDEVDSMLIDENAKIAMLSHHIPATEYLEPLLSIIWDELNRFDSRVVYLPETGTWNYVDGAFKYENNQIMLQDENSNIYELEDVTQFRFEHLKYHLEKVIAEEVIHIPIHLKELALSQIKVWIKSCITAKNLTPKKDYLIIQDENSNYVIVPIDYHNTGIVQAKTSWTNGLHQLLQIKHGLKITAESLVTSFISNLGFFKIYGKKIYGMTGTLGSIDAQSLLAYIYEIDLVFIPTYKIKRFQELPSILSNSEEEWLANITRTTIEHTSNGRAVLIICESIKNVELVNNALLAIGHPNNHIKLYSRNDTNENLSVAESIDSKDIIIATNLAGRGTDIKTTGNVEKNGGLHVCVSFLPANLRVELQAFGRTARQGNEGTAQLIINEQEASQLLHIDSNTITTIEEFKTLRDEQEHNKLQRVKLYDAEKIILEDQLFSLFCKLTHTLKAKENSKSKLSQLEENWGITFKNIKQLIANILNSLPEEEKTNPNSIKNIILGTKQQALLKFNEFHARMLLEYSSGYEIMRNPAYLVTESFNNMATGGYARSAELFALAANLDDNFSISAHYNAAYAIIRGKIGNYKQEAFEHLELAADGIKQTLIPSLEVLQVTGSKSSDSPLTKQIIQKIELLKLQLSYIDKTKATITGCADRNYIEISENKLLREFFTPDKTPEAEILELNVFGVHSFYDVKEVEPPTDVFGAIFMAVAAVVQIGIGIACTMSGNVALGAAFLIEGFQDGLKAMKIANNEDFDWKNYFSAKGISAAVTVITIGTTNLMNKLATAKTAAELGKEAAKEALKKAGKEITEKAIKQELMKAALKEVVKRVVINTAIDKIANKAMGHVLNEFKDEIRGHVERNINHCLDSAVTHNQLMHLFELDHFNGNTNNYRIIMESALNVLKHNQSVLNNIAHRVINEMAANPTMPGAVKAIGITTKMFDTGKALIDIQNVVDKVQDRLSSNIANLGQRIPDIAGILEQKLQPVFNSTKARETVAILENQGFILNGRFVKIDNIENVDFDKYDHLKAYIVKSCIRLYDAQHQDYGGLKQKLKSDLTNHVVRSMLGSIRSEIMHPVLASPLAKLSNMVTEGIAKTFAEFTDGQRLKAIEAKIAANANKQAEASYNRGAAVAAGDEDGNTQSDNKQIKKYVKKLEEAVKQEIRDGLIEIEKIAINVGVLTNAAAAKMQEVHDKIDLYLKEKHPTAYRYINTANLIANEIFKLDPASRFVLEKALYGLEKFDQGITEVVAKPALNMIGLKEGDPGYKAGNFGINLAAGGAVFKTVGAVGKALTAETSIAKTVAKVESVAVVGGENLASTAIKTENLIAESTQVNTSQNSWMSWNSVEKTIINNKEYAKIDNMLYTRHALENTYPTALGHIPGHTSVHAPIGVSPAFVKMIIESPETKIYENIVNGVKRTLYQNNRINVVMENNIVVTVSKLKQ